MILDRYIIKEIVPNVFIGLMIFTFVMLMNQILLLAEILITRRVDFINIFLIIYYSLPALTVLTIPMSLLLGVLLGLGRLSSDSELTVMRAAGISLYRIAVPILILSLLCLGICSYLIHVAVPWGNYSSARFMYKIITTNATSEIKPRVFDNRFPGKVIYIQDIPSQETNVWKGVFIYDEATPEKPRLILAREGIVQTLANKNELEVELKNGSWHEVNPRKPQDYTSVYFFQNIFPIPIARFSAELAKSDRDQTVAELKKTIESNRARGLPTANLEVEIQKKYAIPFACLVFGFLAIALGVSSRRGGRSSAYAISIGIILIYYIFLIGGERFGDAGTVPSWLAAWCGNIVLGLLGIVLFLQSNSSTLTNFFSNVAASARRKRAEAKERAVQTRRIRVVLRIQRFPFRVFTLLDKYIVREFMKVLVLTLIALVTISELIVATQLVDDLFRNKVGVDILLQYLKFNFPQWIFWVLPVSAMTTTLVTFGMLTRNSEVIAMRSSGISLYRIALPVMIVAAALCGIAYWLQDYILPVTNKIANNYRSQIRGEPPELFSSFERHWLSGTDGFYNYDVFNVRTNTMYGFSVFQVDPENFKLVKRIYARQAEFEANKWYLKQGWQRTFQRGRARYETFRTEEIKLPVTPDYFRTEQEMPSEMTFAELRDYVERIKQRGFDFIRFAVDLQAKLSFPTVSLILTLIAIPFSFTMGKRGALFGIGLSIVMGIVFWFFLALTKSLGYLEILNPFLAAWTPNIIATLLALYLLFKLRT